MHGRLTSENETIHTHPHGGVLGSVAVAGLGQRTDPGSQCLPKHTRLLVRVRNCSLHRIRLRVPVASPDSSGFRPLAGSCPQCSIQLCRIFADAVAL